MVCRPIVGFAMAFALAGPAHALENLDVTLDPNGTVNGGIGWTADGTTSAQWTLHAPSPFEIEDSALTVPGLWQPVSTDQCAASHIYQIDIGPQGVNKNVKGRVEGELMDCDAVTGEEGELPDFESNVIHVDLDADTDNTGGVGRGDGEDAAEDQDPGLLLCADGPAKQLT